MYRTPKEHALLVIAEIPESASYEEIEEWLESFAVISPRPHAEPGESAVDGVDWRSPISDGEREELRGLLLDDLDFDLDLDVDDLPF